jgi:hypothetical protein
VDLRQVVPSNSHHLLGKTTSTLQKELKRAYAGHWWPLVILATQEAEIKRIMVQSQPQAGFRPYLKKKKLLKKKKGLVEWLKQ